MPIYEYVCTACQEKFEVQRKFSDPPIETCAEFSCPKGEPVEKIISSPAIMFKGSGWYVTDYSEKLKEPKRPGEDGKPQGKPGEEKPATAETKSNSSATATTSTKSGESGSTTSSSNSSTTTTSSTSSGSTPSTSSPPSSTSSGKA